MKKTITNNKSLLTYLLLISFISCFILFLFFYDRTSDTRHQKSAYNVTTWSDYTVIESMYKTIVNGDITIDNSVGNILAFYSVHQSVFVYADDELIYQYPVANNNLFSKSPGYSWNFMELPNDVNNIQIIIKSPYNSNLANIPTFYIGNDISLIAYFFSKESFAVFICIAMFVYGIILIAYYFVFAHNIANNKLLKLGLFSILLSIWSLNECSVIKLLLRNNIVTSYISFLALMLLPFPFAQFVQSFYEDKSRIWDLFYKVDLIQIIASLLLCIIKLYDLSQTLWMTHAMLITVGVIVIVETILLNRDYVLSEQIKLHMFCTLICLGCMFLDLVGYYMGVGDNSRFNRVGFLLYILVLGVTSMKATKNLVKDADAYQTLAYTDQMTGLNNRTCFNKDFAILSNTPNDIAVIDFDLNNLKKTNDTYGHSAGDKYITTCATIIHDIFKGIGKCYRVGGDEFVTLIERASTVDLTHYLAMLESSVDSANKGMKNWKMQIAYGYTIYDSDMDKNLEDTYNRADKIMYQNKEDKKTFRRT